MLNTNQNYFNQESERLIFRKLTKNDIESWTEFFENNDRLKFLGLPDISKDKTEIATEWIERQLERYEKEGFGHLAAIEKSTGEFIGMGGILPRIILEQNEFEIAYSLKPKFWKQGFGTEIANQMRKYGFENAISSKFISIIATENLDSIKVAKKNGMKIIHEMEYSGMKVYVFGISI